MVVQNLLVTLYQNPHIDQAIISEVFHGEQTNNALLNHKIIIND